MSLENDFKAIGEFDTKQHLYLTVTGEGANQHLSVEKRGFFGRLWMKLGLSDSSIQKVSTYINNLAVNEEFIKKLNQKINTDGKFKDNFTILEAKLFSHYHNQLTGVISPSGDKANKAYIKLNMLREDFYCDNKIFYGTKLVEDKKNKLITLKLAADSIKDPRMESKLREEISELNEEIGSLERELALATLSRKVRHQRDIQ